MDFDDFLTRQGWALGRSLKPHETLRRALERRVGGRLYSTCLRRLSPPNRIRDDVSVDGTWRFSESFDGTRAWYRDERHRDPREATGRALAGQRWAGCLLDHLLPLEKLRRSGCLVTDGGLATTARGEQLPTLRIALDGAFAETVFLDAAGRIAAHRMDLPEAGDEERELELCVDAWDSHDGLVYPCRSTVIDRATLEAVAEVVVTDIAIEPCVAEVFTLAKD